MKKFACLSLVLLALPALAQERLYNPTSEALTRPDGARGSGFPASYDFEPPTYAPGDLDGQDGWFAQFGNWIVEATNPAGGVQQVRGLSDGLGQTFALTEDTTGGTEAYGCATGDLYVADSPANATWEFIPQDPTSFVITRVRINPDFSIDALDAVANDYVPTGAVFPADSYTSVAVVTERATGLFDLYLDGGLVFSGQGFGVDLQNIAILSAMEAGTTGDTFDFDNIQLIDTADPTCGLAPSVPVTEVPTAGFWGLVTLVTALGLGGLLFVRRIG